MKQLLKMNTKQYSLLILSALLVFSCVDEDKLFELDQDFDKGALLNFTQTANDPGFVDIFNLDDVVLEFSVDFTNALQQSADGGKTSAGSGRETTDLEFAPVQSYDIEVMYTSVTSGERYSGMLVAEQSSWPNTFSIDLDEIINAIEEIESQDQLEIGDVFTISSGIQFQDGRKSPAFVPNTDGFPVLAYSASFFNQPGLNIALNYPVSCSSNLPVEGTWTATTTQGAFGVFSTNEEVTITPLGSGQYAISDVTGGFYVAFGFDENQPVVFQDVCNSITIVSNTDAQFNIGTDATNGFPAGTWDEATETFTIPWYDAGNAFGDVTVLTRN